MQHNMLTGLVSEHLHLNTQKVRSVEPHLSSFIIIIIFAHQHKACKQLKIKQEMIAVGD